MPKLPPRSALGPSAGLALLAAVALTSPAAADSADEIRARFAQWTEDFNAGRADAVCDLFSQELVSDVRGQGEANFATRCDILQKSLAERERKFHYAFEIREIIVAGDLAVVRLVWTLTITPQNLTAVEPGMDIFRKEPDGKWRIIRYMAYEAE